MPVLPKHRIAFFAVTMLMAGNVAAQAVPTVYQDENITVRSGIPQAGTQSVHIGDALTLVIDIAFDAGRVQIENPGDEIFERAFAGTPSIRLYEPGTVSQREDAGDRVRVIGRWRIQVLDCPGDMTSCPGKKVYALPIMTVSYQLIDAAGRSASDSRLARFRPWPGSIAVAPAIAVTPEPGTDLTDVLPGGAYAKPQPIAESASTTSMLLVAGALLFATGLIASVRTSQPLHAVARHHVPSSRWEHALERLRDESLRDDEWCDLLRRCVTWYCLDERSRNPYAWLGAAASDSAPHQHAESELREFFLDVLSHEGIGRPQRDEYLDRLCELTGQASNVKLREQPA